jgi:Rrf2 family protein
MLRLSKLTDYAIVVLVRLAQAERAAGSVIQTGPGVAAATGIPEPTVAKVLKALAGGNRLTRPLAAIPVSEVIAAIDGPIALTACVDGSVGGCESENLCPVRGRWDPVNEAIQTALGAITLADMEEASVPRAFRLPARALQPAAE